jgi:hypothetical protein
MRCFVCPEFVTLSVILLLSSACSLFEPVKEPLDELDMEVDADGTPDQDGDLAEGDMPADMPDTQDNMPDMQDMTPDMQHMGPDMARGMTTSSMRLVAVPARTHQNRLGYYEYRPAQLSTSAPLIIWLHDAGATSAAGPDVGLDALLTQPLIERIALDHWPDEAPAWILAPRRPGGQCMTPLLLADFIGFALNHYPELDPAQVHVIGLGCGATAAWDYLASDYTNPITSATLIGGDGRAAAMKAGCRLRRAAIWALAGANDAQADGTSQPLAQLTACMAAPGQGVLRGEVRAGLSSDAVARELVAAMWPMSPEPSWLDWLARLTSAFVRPTEGFPVSLRFGRRVRLDLGQSASKTMAAGWNNLSACETAGAQVTFVDDVQVPTLSAVTLEDAFDGSQNSGTTDMMAPYAAEISMDGCFVGAAELQDARQRKAQLRLTGLIPAERYDLVLYASRMRPMFDTIGRVTRYVLSGMMSVSATLDASDNITRQLTLSNVQADADGALLLEISVVAQDNNLYGYLNALELVAR